MVGSIQGDVRDSEPGFKLNFTRCKNWPLNMFTPITEQLLKCQRLKWLEELISVMLGSSQFFQNGIDGCFIRLKAGQFHCRDDLGGCCLDRELFERIVRF